MNDIRVWFNKKQDDFYPKTKEGANILTSRITTVGTTAINTGIEILSGYGATVENYSDALTRLFNLGIYIKIPEHGANNTIIMKEYNSIEDIQIISLTFLGKNIMVPCSKNDAALLATINSEEQTGLLTQIAQLTYFKTEKTDLSATWNYKPSGSSGTSVWSWEVNMTPDKESFYINALCTD